MSEAGKSSIVFRWIRIIVPIVFLFALLGGWVLFLRKPAPPLPPPPPDALYRLPGHPIEERVSDLMGRMTLDEKIGQMTLVEKNSVHDLNDVSSYGLGAILSGAGAKPMDDTPEGWLAMVNGFQNASRKSRLGIPILYGEDANHGTGNVPGATIFPHMIGLGASGDAALVQRVARATADEMAATGIYWTYSPTLDLPEDIRWGRAYEAFTDDPVLASRLGAAYVRGTQEQTLNSAPAGINVISAAKHFIGAGAMMWGSSSNKNFQIDQGRTLADESALNASYLPPFKAAVDAGALSVMVGLNSWGDDAWMSYQKPLITDALKGRLGFTGFVVSDWYGVYEHSTNQYEALVNAVNAGVDMVMLPFDYKGFLMNMRLAVEKGDIPQARVDDAVRRILNAKFAAGLFERPAKSDPPLSVIGSADHRAIARDAVSKSLVLLKNNRVLPLSPKTGRILVAGSAADNVGRQCGAWTVEWQGVDENWLPGGTSILQGITQSVSSSTVVVYDRDANFPTADGRLADVGIAVVGEKPYAEGWGDNANPSLDQADLDAIARLSSVSKKVVVIVVSGRPLMITDQLPKWDALVETWLPGSEGEGVADVLFGKKPFTGKLPLPWPASVSQLPISTDGKTTDGTKVLFPRGFGMK
jgi:beta-glucosidase